MSTDQDPVLTQNLTPIPIDAPPRGPLTDAELQADHPAVAVLVAKLDGIAEEAPYMSDPRQGSKRIALALAEYFRTPDTF